MEIFFIDYINNLQELHDDIRTALVGLPQAALDWAPGPDTNSLNVLVTHLTGAERYWLGDVIAGEPSGRDREAEFRVRGLTIDSLVQRLNDIESLAQRVLAALSLSDLEATRVSPRNGRQVTVAWALDHALKHTALHLGQIQLTRQLWEQTHPS